MIENSNFLTIRQFSLKHPAFKESGLRWLRFNCESNGFSSSFKKVGRRVLIDEENFFRCIDEQNQTEL